MNVLAIIGRLLYTPTEYCRACREPIWTIFSRQVVCGTCRRLLLDSRSRTSSRERTAGARRKVLAFGARGGVA